MPPHPATTQPESVTQAEDQIEQEETVEEILLRAFPDNFRILRHLSELRSTRGEAHAASELLKRAVSIKPDSAQIYVDLGRILVALNRLEEALCAYQDATALDPKNLFAQTGFGELLVALGQIEDGIQALERAVELAPQSPGTYLALLRNRHTTHRDQYVFAVEKLAENPDILPPNEQISLHFCLGTIYADLGEHDRSFKHLLAGNTLKRQWIAYDERNNLEQLDRMRMAFTAELLDTWQGHGDPTELPIFIFGAPVPKV